MASRGCLNNKDEFCYICGKYFGKRRNYPIKNNQQLQTSFESYFDLKLSHDIDKVWAPSCVCSSCHAVLNQWWKGKKKYFPFSVPRVWREPEFHGEGGCYFCSIKLKSGKAKTFYPNLSCSTAPVPRNGPPPEPNLQASNMDENFEAVDSDHSSTESDFKETEEAMVRVNLPRFNEIIKDLQLSKRSSFKLLAQLKENNLTAPSVTYRSIRHRSDGLKSYFIEEGNICYCTDIPGLITLLYAGYDQNDWILFIDGSLQTIKAVLIQINNEKNPIPILYGKHMKENYEVVHQIMDKINYQSENWKICCDFKVNRFLIHSFF